MTQTKQDKPGSNPVSFRLSGLYQDRLDGLARRRGMSPHQYARLAVVMHIEDTAIHKVLDEVAALRAENARVLDTVVRVLQRADRSA